MNFVNKVKNTAVQPGRVEAFWLGQAGFLLSLIHICCGGQPGCISDGGSECETGEDDGFYIGRRICCCGRFV